MARRQARRASLAFAALFCAISLAFADERSHRYKRGDPLRLWVNKVGPYRNPQQTYYYDTLPLCSPESAQNKRPARKWGGLGEVLGGNKLVDSQIEGFAFLEPVPKEKQRICSQVLDAKAVGSLTRAVRNHFWFELFLDDLPIWGFVGPPPPRRSEEEGADDDDEDDDGNKGDPSSPYPHVYTHRAFDISYNAAADRIIQVNLTSENPQPLVQGQELTFTYEVRWSLDDSGTPFSRRFEKYLDKDFFQHRVHWWALANAAATVTFLMVLVAAILLRTLRADVARYNSSNNGATAASLAASKALGGGGGSSSSPSRLDFDLDDFDDESGWKVLSGDVFRSPNRLPLLSALVGTGAQLCLLAFLTSAAAALGSLFEERGSVTTFAVVFYALTSVVGGYVAGETFSRCSSAGGGKAKAQARTWLLTATLLPLSTFAVGGCVNAVALFHRSLAAVPLRGVAGVLALWLLLSAPLCRLGFALGRRRWQRKLSAAATNAGDPARTKRVPSPIPAKPWHRSRASVCLLAGVLPFLSILVEMSFVFAAMWNYKILYLYWTLVLALGLLLAATALSSIVAVYSLLCAEDHRWHWASFSAGFSPALYVLCYAVRYFFTGTQMNGGFQTCFYFGWSFLLCLALGTATGSVGFLASAAFVRRIYRSVKCD